MAGSYHTVVNSHRSAHVPADPNNTLEISGHGGSPGKPHPEYRVFRFGEEATPVAVLRFHTADAAGLTNEALLAVVCDRLREFQAGEQPCVENEHAVAHVVGALHALKNRTNHRHAAGAEGATVEQVAFRDAARAVEVTPRPRISLGRDGETYLNVFTVNAAGGPRMVAFEIAKLRSGLQWAVLADAVATIPAPPLTPEEVATLASVADHQVGRLYLKTLGVTVMPEDAKNESPHRVRVENARLYVGTAAIAVADLAAWATWSAVETACKRLDPPLSPLELEVICKAAEHLGPGARNGLTELKSALASTRAAKIG